MYIKNLPDKVKKTDMKTILYTLFSTYGTVLDVVVMRTDKMRGQAHVVFRDVQASTQAMRALQGFEICGKEMVNSLLSILWIAADPYCRILPTLKGVLISLPNSAVPTFLQLLLPSNPNPPIYKSRSSVGLRLLLQRRRNLARKPPKLPTELSAHARRTVTLRKHQWRKEKRAMCRWKRPPTKTNVALGCNELRSVRQALVRSTMRRDQLAWNGQVDAVPDQAEPDQQVLLGTDVSVAHDIPHGLGGIAWVDKVSWNARHWVILFFAFRYLKTQQRAGESMFTYPEADAAHDPTASQGRSVLRGDEVSVYGIHARGSHSGEARNGHVHNRDLICRRQNDIIMDNKMMGWTRLCTSTAYFLNYC